MNQPSRLLPICAALLLPPAALQLSCARTEVLPWCGTSADCPSGSACLVGHFCGSPDGGPGVEVHADGGTVAPADLGQQGWSDLAVPPADLGPDAAGARDLGSPVDLGAAVDLGQERDLGAGADATALVDGGQGEDLSDLSADSGPDAAGDVGPGCDPVNVCQEAQVVDGHCVRNARTCPPTGDPCTRQQCIVARGGCAAVPIDGDCSDGDPCNGLELCVQGACQHGAPVVCPGGEACVDGGCPAVCSSACDCPQGHACVDGACAEAAGSGYCCEQDGCPLAGACQFADGAAGLCGGTLDFDHDLQGGMLDANVDVEQLFLPAGVQLYTQRNNSTVSTNSYRVASASQRNSCATRDDQRPHSTWLGDIFVQFQLPRDGQYVQGATHQVSLYIAQTWPGGIAVELYSPQGENFTSQLTDQNGTDFVDLVADRPIGFVHVRSGSDPDFAIDDLSFGPISQP